MTNLLEAEQVLTRIVRWYKERTRQRSDWPARRTLATAATPRHGRRRDGRSWCRPGTAVANETCAWRKGRYHRRVPGDLRAQAHHTGHPDDCERFQHEALKRPRNWRRRYPKGKKTTACLSPNTVLKWSRSLQAAFERVNRNAGRRRCVRGVVDASRLLTANPWNQFNWIEGVQRPIRQFDSEELLALLTFLETEWKDVPLGALAAKAFLWSGARKLEIASLQWSQVRVAVNEYHYQIVGKWGVERWFRLPETLYHDLLGQRTDSPFVFADYNDQIRRHADKPGTFKKITEDYDPRNLGRWFYERIKEWSASSQNGRAFEHVFRKTTLQHARTQRRGRQSAGGR